MKTILIILNILLCIMLAIIISLALHKIDSINYPLNLSIIIAVLSSISIFSYVLYIINNMFPKSKKRYKRYKDLKFTSHTDNSCRAIMDFDNKYRIDIVKYNESYYISILHNCKFLKTLPAVYTKEEITKTMIQVQKLEPKTNNTL